MPVTQDNKNWSRYGLALCTEGRDALACVFTWLYKGGFPVTVSNVNLFDQEKKKLQDSTDAAAFDITLLYKLLRRVCGLADIKDPTWTTPGPSGPSLEHLIFKLKTFRDYDWGHINKMTEQDLKEKLTELRNILKMMLVKAGAQCGKDSREVDRKFRNFTEYIDERLEKITEPLHPSEMARLNLLFREDLNRFRYSLAVTKAGRDALARVFEWLYKGSYPIDTYITQTLGFTKAQYRRVFDAYQRHSLDNSIDVTTFDITLLYSLLQRVCGLADTNDPMWTTPGPLGPSLEHLIYKLKQHRNTLAHEHVKMTEHELKTTLTELSDLLKEMLRVAGARGGRDSQEVDQVIKDVTEYIEGLSPQIREQLDQAEVELLQEVLLVLQEQDLNQWRYEFAVIKAGTLVLDTVFRWSYRGTFPVHNYLTEELGYRNAQYRPTFDAYQRDKLEASADSTSFDFILLYKLLQRVCGLADINDFTWTTPGPLEPSLEHLIYKLKQHRNVAVRGRLRLTEQDLKTILEELKDLMVQVLIQAGLRFGITDNDVSQVINSVTEYIDALYTQITELMDPSDLADMEIPLQIDEDVP